MSHKTHCTTLMACHIAANKIANFEFDSNERETFK